MTDQVKTHGPGTATYFGSSFDPFRAHHPAVLVHDVGAAEFARAWADCEAQGAGTFCPVCHKGTPAEHGVAKVDGRAWVRFSCGEWIAEEQCAG